MSALNPENGEPIEARSTWQRAAPWIVAAVVISLLAAALRAVDLYRVLEILKAADLRFAMLAVIVNLTFNAGARIQRRRGLVTAAIAPGKEVGLMDFAALYFAGTAGNNLLPARAGDVLFTFGMRRRFGLSLAAVATAQLSEKIIEIGSLWVLSPLALVLTDVGPVLRFPLYVFIAGGALTLTLLAAFTRNIGHSRFEAVKRILSPRVFARALLWSLLQDLSDIAMVGLVAAAVAVHVGAGGWLLVYLAVNLASGLPSAPGQIGLIEAGAVTALVGQGVGAPDALAFALLYHAIQFIPTTLVGALPLMRASAR